MHVPDGPRYCYGAYFAKSQQKFLRYKPYSLLCTYLEPFVYVYMCTYMTLIIYMCTLIYRAAIELQVLAAVSSTYCEGGPWRYAAGDVVDPSPSGPNDA